MRPFLLAVAVLLAVPAFAQANLAGAPRRALLSGSQGSNPKTKGSLVLVGLGLTAAGLVLGGAGFGILYACREGQECHGDKTLNIVGWALAAPGVIPLAIGLIILYGAVGGGKGSHGASAISWGVSPLPGGAIGSAAFRF